MQNCDNSLSVSNITNQLLSLTFFYFYKQPCIILRLMIVVKNICLIWCFGVLYYQFFWWVVLYFDKLTILMICINFIIFQGMKVACTHFQAAAGIFQFLKVNSQV